MDILKGLYFWFIFLFRKFVFGDYYKKNNE